LARSQSRTASAPSRARSSSLSRAASCPSVSIPHLCKIARSWELGAGSLAFGELEPGFWTFVFAKLESFTGSNLQQSAIYVQVNISLIDLPGIVPTGWQIRSLPTIGKLRTSTSKDRNLPFFADCDKCLELHSFRLGVGTGITRNDPNAIFLRRAWKRLEKCHKLPSIRISRLDPIGTSDSKATAAAVNLSHSIRKHMNR
jgi:hypothetical protein